MKRKPKYACIEQHYAIGKTLGEGTFGKVRKGKHKLSGVKVTNYGYFTCTGKIAE